MIIPPWIKYAVLLLVLAAYGGGAFWLGGEHTRKVAAEEKAQEYLGIISDNNQHLSNMQAQLDKAPKSETKIREITKMYPAPCPMPEPVADGLQAAIDTANAARKVP